MKFKRLYRNKGIVGYVKEGFMNRYFEIAKSEVFNSWQIHEKGEVIVHFDFKTLKMAIEHLKTL